MASKTFSTFARATALIGLLLFADAALAQQVVRTVPPAGGPRPASSRTAFRIKDISKPGKSSLISSPDVDGKVKSPGHISRGQNWKWAMLEVKYETAPEWIDEATFTFYVLCQDSKTKVYHFFQTAVSYLDIAKGDHVAAAMLPPNAVVRYGEPISFGVEVAIEGEKVAETAVGVGGPGWWATLDRLGDRVKRHSGYLQDRSRTPFGVTHVDEYEAVR